MLLESFYYYIQGYKNIQHDQREEYIRDVVFEKILPQIEITMIDKSISPILIIISSLDIDGIYYLVTNLILTDTKELIKLSKHIYSKYKSILKEHDSKFNNFIETLLLSQNYKNKNELAEYFNIYKTIQKDILKNENR